MGKTSISVPEMRRVLGMKKVEAYWLVKQGRFKVILVGGKMRIGTAGSSITKRSMDRSQDNCSPRHGRSRR